MWRKFRIKLLAIMVVFAVMIAFTIATINHLRIAEQTIQVNQSQVEKIETMIAYALHTTDKAYFYFDEEVTEKMRANTMHLMKLYETNDSIDTWDMAGLKDELEMDIYIINSDNVITESTKQSDIGMDFNACCGRLAKILNERRESGTFYHDGMDIAQATEAGTKFDELDHAEGDQLLKRMAKTIQLALHSEIKTYRLGGDEFAVILRNTNQKEAVQIAKQIIEALDRDIRERYKESGIDLTASIVITFLAEAVMDGIALYKQADIALYKAKEKGKNQYQVFK